MVVTTVNEKLFVYPTDTVWGIGGSIFSNECYRKIADIKGHEEKKPLSVLFYSIEEIRDLINLPPEFSDLWLEEFFKFESTLGVPKEWSKKELPNWICQDSKFLTIRCLKSKMIKKVIDMVGGPITSTSLNFSGFPPIVDGVEAREFYEEHMKEEVFIENHDAPCSGRSSTIVLLGEEKHNIVREGQYVNEIKEHLKLLST